MADTTKIIETKLDNGKTILVKAVPVGGGQDVAKLGLPEFSEVTTMIQSVGASFYAALEAIAPKKASVEFGVEVAVKGGKLVGLLVDGSATATIKVTLEWGG
jgi:hypothetical protein